MHNIPRFLQRIVFGTNAAAFVKNLETIPFGPRSTFVRRMVSLAFFALMVKLNVNVVRNLFSRRQLMNASFGKSGRGLPVSSSMLSAVSSFLISFSLDPLRLANSYGAFGVVSEERHELIISSAQDVTGPWREYEFKIKPGDVTRTPRFITPYHHRLDWQMWISSQIGGIERSPWLYSLLYKLLKQERDVVSLLASDPWAPVESRVRKWLGRFGGSIHVGYFLGVLLPLSIFNYFDKNKWTSVEGKQPLSSHSWMK